MEKRISGYTGLMGLFSSPAAQLVGACSAFINEEGVLTAILQMVSDLGRI